MAKQKLFLDFDNTIVNSSKAFCFCYNEIYKHHEDFIPAIWQKVNKYDFADQCLLLELEMLHKIFGSQMFFNELNFMDKNTYDVIRELNEHYQIIIVSIGTFDNISLKSQWIKESLPFIKEAIFITNDGCKMNKSIINMNQTDNEYPTIFIDDVASNLESSNAIIKIVFGEVYEWNKDWCGQRYYNWTEIKNVLK